VAANHTRAYTGAMNWLTTPLAKVLIKIQILICKNIPKCQNKFGHIALSGSPTPFEGSIKFINCLYRCNHHCNLQIVNISSPRRSQQISVAWYQKCPLEFVYIEA